MYQAGEPAQGWGRVACVRYCGAVGNHSLRYVRSGVDCKGGSRGTEKD